MNVVGRGRPELNPTPEFLTPRVPLCDELWNTILPVPYPSFENWRGDSDRFVAVA